MSGIIFICGILLCRVFQKTATKAISKRLPSDMAGISGYNAISMGISAAFAAILLLFNFSITQFTQLPILGWVISCATGVTICLATICSLFAMRGSSILLNSLFSMAGLLIPTISGIFILGQAVMPMQWLGMLILFVSALILTSASNKTNGKISTKTILLLFTSMIANGATMLLQVLYKTYVPTGSVLVYSFLQFSITSAFLFVLALILSKREKRAFFVPDKKLMSFMVVAAGALFGITQLATMASSVVPVAVLFPITEGGGMVISALVANFVYKEKISLKSIIGIITGVMGLVFLKLFSA